MRQAVGDPDRREVSTLACSNARPELVAAAAAAAPDTSPALAAVASVELVVVFASSPGETGEFSAYLQDKHGSLLLQA